jgi:hypothetical protein
MCSNILSSRTIYGENIGYGYNTWTDMINGWYSEYTQHDFNTEAIQSFSLHFSQIVLKSTTSICKCHTLIYVPLLLPL